MYSLGVVLFELVTGELPFDYENPNKVLLAHVMDPPPNPHDLNPACPPALADVILKTMAKKPDDRYADMQQLILALQEVLAAPEPAPAESAPPAAPPVPAEPEQEGGLGGFFKKLFGRKKETPARKAKEPEISSKTAPREQLSVQPDDVDDDDDDDDYTMQLNLSDAPTAVTARLLIRDKNVTLSLPAKDELIIGRTYGNSTADVDLEPHDASKFGVSRRHARLMHQGNTWLIEDLNSLNGTFVNNKEVKAGQPVPLEEGDSIRLSQMHLTFLSQL
jgi:serine/threonine protein kinase